MFCVCTLSLNYYYTGVGEQVWQTRWPPDQYFDWDSIADVLLAGEKPAYHLYRSMPAQSGHKRELRVALSHSSWGSWNCWWTLISMHADGKWIRILLQTMPGLKISSDVLGPKIASEAISQHQIQKKFARGACPQTPPSFCVHPSIHTRTQEVEWMKTHSNICALSSGKFKSLANKLHMYGHSKLPGWSGFGPTTFPQTELAHVHFELPIETKKILTPWIHLGIDTTACTKVQSAAQPHTCRTKLKRSSPLYWLTWT